MIVVLHNLSLSPGFHAIDMETGSVLDLYVPSAARSGITPHAIIALPRPTSVELLLCYDSQSNMLSYLMIVKFFLLHAFTLLFDRRRGVCELYWWAHQGH